MSPLTLQQLGAEAIERGFTHVLTGAGMIPLDTWQPYGIQFINGRPGSSHPTSVPPPCFRWVDENRATEVTGEVDFAPFVLGVWSFARVDA